MSDDKKDTGGFIQEIYHPPGCGHERPEADGAETSSGGPAKVTTDAYRNGFDNIFGVKKKDDSKHGPS